MSDKYPGGFVTAGAPAGYSVAFDGSGDYLAAPSNAAFAFGTGDFTVEFWLYPTSFSGSFQTYVSTRTGTGSGLDVQLSSGTTLMLGNSAGAIISASNVLTLNVWQHIAASRSGTTNRLFVNGVIVASGTASDNFTSTGCYISSGQGGGNNYAIGYISNVRLLKGTALYTAAFTPPTQLFPITNTSLLTCQSPTIIDTSTNAFTITVNGDAKVSNLTPFAAYTGFNPALGAAAGGVWTLDEAAYYQNNRQWPIYDPYFNQTTLMLHGNGTNNAQNNTFLDSSTNNFTITRNGNTTQGTFTPFSQTGWSLYLPGSGTNYVQTPSSTTTALLGGSLTSLASLSFTIECFINLPVATGTFVIGDCDPAGSTANMIAGINSDGTQSFGATFGGYTTRNGTGAIQFNAWNHVAWVITGGYVYFYINGAPAGSATVGNTSSQYGQLVFGGYNNSFSTKQNVSNFRITKSAIYSGAFTPPTGPLTASTNTTLLTFQGNNYKDYSANNYTLNVVGSPTIQAFSPFVPTVTTPTTYSNWFNGSSGYLTIATGVAFGAGAYTIECWFNANAFGSYYTIIGNGGTNAMTLSVDSATAVKIDQTNVGSTTFTVATMALNTWHHLVVVRNASNVTTVFVDGVRSSTGTATLSNNFSVTSKAIGFTSGGGYWNGFISNLRCVVGTAVYDPTQTSITVPTAPLTAISGTQLLTCQSSTFVDNSTNNYALTLTGVVQPTAASTPFPAKVDQTTLNSAYSTSLIGGSAYFDGTTDFLTAPDNTAFDMSSGNFTVDFWFYATQSKNTTFFTKRTVNTNYSPIMVQWTSGNALILYASTTGSSWTVNGTSAATSLNAWHHVAMVRNSTSLVLYLDGVAVVSATLTGAVFTNTSPFVVGADDAAGNLGYAGYIAGMRVVKGTALYTSNFAPPIAPPTPVTNTQLLLNYTNAGIYDNTAKNLFETVGTAQISTGASKYGGSSMYFNGSTSYLTKPYSPLFAFGNGNFTVECWVNTTQNAGGNYPSVVGRWSGGNSWDLRHSAGDNSNKPTFAYNDGTSNFNVASTGSTIYDGLWHHLAAVRNGNTITLYVDGISVGTSSFSGTIAAATSTPLTVGSTSGGGVYYTGYIDDLRITVGVARYTTNFTPPTSQLQDQ
jgi:hypothetical protein